MRGCYNTSDGKSLACTHTGDGMHSHWTWHAHTLDLEYAHTGCGLHTHTNTLDLVCTQFLEGAESQGL